VDLFLYDLKTVDDERHKECTGVSNQQILDNLKELSERGHRINIRIPIIPGITDAGDDLLRFAEFILSLDSRNEISLLPYHQGASAKYKRLGKPNRMLGISQPSESELEKTKMKLERLGLDVRIGG
jgi:pyruvate formate lyase activating enzyme